MTILADNPAENPAGNPGGNPAEKPGEHPVIVACTDGPLLVRGTIELRESNGDEITPGRRTIALCRCGASTIKPFCDGSHKLINFRA